MKVSTFKCIQIVISTINHVCLIERYLAYFNEIGTVSFFVFAIFTLNTWVMLLLSVVA